MPLSIRTGPAIVVASGAVTAFDDHPIVIAWEQGPLHATVEFRFSTDPDTPDLRVGAQEVDGRAVLDLVNFDSADGRGTAAPLLVAEHPTGRVFLHFKVFRYGKTKDRTVEYTLYVVEGAGLVPPGAGG